jgi:hypothetical protein
MTDLLGLLSGIHRAVVELGDVHLTLTELDGHAGVVDRHTNTVHMQPGLTLPEMLHVLADAVAVLAPQTNAVVPLAVGGGDPCAMIPRPRHLTVIRNGVPPVPAAGSGQVLKTRSWTTPA